MRQYQVIIVINLSILLLVGLTPSSFADSTTIKHITNRGYAAQLQPGMHGWTELMEASLNGNIQIVKSLLNKGVDVDAQSRSKTTAILLAAGKGHIDIVQLLLEHGADLNLSNGRGETPLLEAVKNSHSETIRLLLDRGADANLVIKSNKSPLEMAVVINDLPLVKLLIDRTDLKKFGGYALGNAIYLGRNDIAKFLLDSGVNPNSYLRHGRPILAYAVEQNRTNMVSMLLMKGAKINPKDKAGKKQPILSAVNNGNIAIVEMFIKAGDDLNQQNANRETLLEIAKQKHNGIAALLRKHHAYESSPDIDSFVNTGIEKLGDIFNRSNDDNYLEIMLGKAITIKDLGEAKEKGMSLNRKAAEWIYGGLTFSIVTPDLFVKEIELTSSKYKLTHGLTTNIHKKLFLKKLGPPLKKYNNSFEYRSRVGGEYYFYFRRVVLTTDNRGYVTKINWFDSEDYRWDG